MALPSIAVINFTSTLASNEVLAAIQAVNQQITDNFQPVWGYGRTLEFFSPTFDPADPNTLAEEDVPADSVLYLVDEASVQNALGYHDLNTRDVPFGFVFVLDPNDWTTTLSHECLELILDPTASVLVPGPDPRHPRKTVLHSYEACDAVERLTYTIGGVSVSDFLTPSYFTPGEAAGRRNDFLGVGLTSFGVTRGSHIAFLDPATGQFQQVIGREAPAQRNLARRVESYDHPKAKRPEDESLDRILHAYRGSQLARKATGLPDLRGLTRTARYRDAATRLAAKIAA